MGFDATAVCEGCGRHQLAVGKLRCVAAQSPAGTASVFVLMGQFSEYDEVKAIGSGTYHDTGKFRSSPRVQFFERTLVEAGLFTEAEINAEFAYVPSIRCFATTKVSAVVQQACMQFALDDIVTSWRDTGKRPMVLLWDYNDWTGFGRGKKRTKQTTVGRLITETVVDPGSKEKISIDVFTIDAPENVIDSPHTCDFESWVAYLKLFRKAFDGEWVADVITPNDYHLVKDAAWAISLLDWYAKQPWVAFDIETGNAPHALDIYSLKFKVIMLQLSAAPGHAHAIPLDHHECPLIREPGVLAALIRFLTSSVFKAAHNGVDFDGPAFREWLNRLMAEVGYSPRPVVNTIVDWDTMLADACINETRMHRLKNLAVTYVPRMAHYEDELLAAFPKGAKAMRDYELGIPLETLGRYGAADPDVTGELMIRQIEILRSLESRHGQCWRDIALARGVYVRLHAVGLYPQPQPVEPEPTQLDVMMGHIMHDARAQSKMSGNGIVLDETRTAILRKKLEERRAELLAELQAHHYAQLFRARKIASHAAKGEMFAHGDRLYGYAGDSDIGFKERAIGKLRSDGKFEITAELEYGALDSLKKAKLCSAKGLVPKNKLYTERDIVYQPGNTAHTKTMCLDILKLRSPRQTKSGGVSVDAEALKILAESEPWLSRVLEFRTADKAFNTYGRPYVQGLFSYEDAKGAVITKRGIIRDDGLVHPSFLIAGNDRGTERKDQDDKGGAKTWRHSSRDPNAQNFASHTWYGRELYSLFVSRFRNPKFPVVVDAKHANSLWLGNDDKGIKAWPSYLRDPVERFIFPGEHGSGGILALDYSQLELYVGAVVMNLSWMIERYKHGADLHWEMAVEVFELDERSFLIFDAETGEVCGFTKDGKEHRSAAKQFWFGPFYGQSPQGLLKKLHKVGVMSRRTPETLITLEEVELILSKLYAKLKEYEAFKQLMIVELQRTGAIQTVSGRRRFMPEFVTSRHRGVRGACIRQGVNCHVQGPGGDCNNYTGWRVTEILDGLEYVYNEQQGLLRRLDREFDTKMIIQVHDSSVFDCPSHEIPEVAALVREVMINIPIATLSPQNMPFSLKTEPEVGPSWGELEEYTL